jgi:hypothetical protein
VLEEEEEEEEEEDEKGALYVIGGMEGCYITAHMLDAVNGRLMGI